MQRWHYARLSFMDGWAELMREGDIDDDDDISTRFAKACALQDTMLDELGANGFVVYDVKIDQDSRPCYFLRQPID